MTGTSRYINGGSTTKPDAGGTYTLGDNTTIEFAGSSGVTIRLGLSSLLYANIVVSGTNVRNSSVVTGIRFKSGGLGTLTVKNGAIFKLNNTTGFTGSSSTAIDNTNAPTVILESGSTVEYSGTDQTITNQAGLPYSNLTVSGSGNKTAPAGILTVRGDLSKSGTSAFLHNNGTVLLDGGGTQNFAGLTYNNLILSNSIKNTSGSSVIIDSIKVNPGAILSISNNDTIILHSDAAKTARMGQLNGGTINYNSNGKFIVERYISSKRAWRFLSIATNDPLQSIKNQWQEGAAAIGIDPKPGFGTQITSNLATWSAKGFDSYSQNGPSMKYYDPLTDTYIGISSTTSAFNSSLGGYMTFVRGDRSATVFGSPVTSTVLRSNGALFTGAQPDIVAKTGKLIPVNNPFASSIDLRKISASYNVFYYVWDPNRTGGAYGLGAFQTLAWNGTDYSVIPGSSGSYGTTNNFIESGQAFFVGTLGADTSMQLTENAKSDATFAISPFTPVGATGQQMRANLYVVGADGSTSLADGVLTNFSDFYNNAIDGMDARKLANFGEDLSIQSHHRSLTVERRKTVHPADTLFYNVARLRGQSYRLEFITDQLDKNGLDGYLEDSYLKTRALINLNGNTQVDFTVDNNPAQQVAVSGLYLKQRQAHFP